jgi:hypothetical protein
MAKQPAKTNAQRQRDFRAKHFDPLAGGNDVRAELVLSLTSKCALQRISRHRNETQRDTLETLIGMWQDIIVGRMTSAEQEHYYRDL